MRAEDAERVDFDGGADGHQHLGVLSGGALSCLHPSQEKGLCHPMRRSDEATNAHQLLPPQAMIS